nr:hypothetical protein [Nevskia ramosa]
MSLSTQEVHLQERLQDGRTSGLSDYRERLIVVGLLLVVALFATPWSQLQKYRTYLAGNSVLATHQVVKGSELLHVMVVMDDKLAGGNQISYDKIFGGVQLSNSDWENVGKRKETTIDRTLRLLYVTCSRAQESLAFVLWSSDPATALNRIKESNWFSEGEFVAIQ